MLKSNIETFKAKWRCPGQNVDQLVLPAKETIAKGILHQRTKVQLLCCQLGSRASCILFTDIELLHDVALI